MANLSPVVLFVYRRPYHTLQTLHSLAANTLSKESELFIFADGPSPNASVEEIKAIQAVRQIITQEKWCKQVHIQTFPENRGMLQNLTEGVTQVLNEYGKIIVLEDDLLLSPGFLSYMNQALNLYESESKVMQINAYMYPIRVKLPETFFYNVITTWGWATWKRAWDYFEPDPIRLLEKLKTNNLLDRFDLQGSEFFMGILKNCIEGKNQSWGIRWYASVCLQEGFCLCPRQSLVQNIGFDNSGTHAKKSNIYHIPQLASAIEVQPIPMKENVGVRKRMREFHRYGGVGIFIKLLHHFNRLKGRLYVYLPPPFKKNYKKLKKSWKYHED